MAELFYCACGDYLSALTPEDGDEITVKVRLKGEAEVFIEYTEELFNLSENRYKREKTYFLSKNGKYEYRFSKIKLAKNNVRFHFVYIENGVEYIYDAGGKELKTDKTKDFILTPDFGVPNWAKGALWYQIMPDSFFNGDVLNDKSNSGFTQENAWGNGHFGGEDYFGGDLDGIIRKLDYITSFGVNAISINPIWMSTHNAGYGADDLTDVDSCFGGDDGLKRFIAAAHEKGIKVCLDGVFDYIVPKAKWYNADGLYPFAGGVKENDPYYDIYLRDECGRTIPSFWGQPLVDFSSDKARAIIYENDDSVVKTYLKPPYNIDAWRMDVGNIYEGSDPEHYGNSVDVIRDMRKNIKAVNPDALLITENDLPKMRAFAVNDSKWNYELGVPVREWAAGKKTETEFAKLVDENTKPLSVENINACFNHVTTHDTARIIDTAGGDINAVKAATVFNMTFPGAPSIYFGDENGEKGKPYPSMGLAAPTSFGSLSWYDGDRNDEIFALYKTLGRERSENREFYSDAGYEILRADDESKILVFVRFKNNEIKLIATNRSAEARTVKVDVSAYAAYGEFIDILSGSAAKIDGGEITLTVFPGGALYTKGGKALNIDGYLTSGVIKTGINEYRVAGMTSFDVFGSFDVLYSGDFGEKTEVVFDKISVVITADGVFVGKNSVYKGKAGSVALKREKFLTLQVDGKDVFVFRGVLPAKSSVKLKAVNAAVAIVKNLRGACAYADFSDYGGNFFSEAKGEIVGGKLKLDGERAILPVRCDDFTFTAGVCGNGGVVVTDGEQNLSFKYENGKLTVDLLGVTISRADIDEAPEYLKIEKCGARYRFIAAGETRTVTAAENVKFNISEIYVGIFSDGECLFSKAYFGDNGKTLRNYSKDVFDLSTRAYADSLSIPVLRVVNGDISPYYAGYVATGDESEMTLDGKYKSFTLLFSLETNNVAAEVNCGRLKLTVTDKETAFGSGEDKIVARRDSDKSDFVIVKNGEKAYLYENGAYVGESRVENEITGVFFKGNGNYKLTNIGINRTDVSYFTGRGKIFPMKEGFDISSEQVETAYAYYGKAVQNFAFSANIKFNRSASVDKGFFSVCFGLKAGEYPENRGASIRFYKETKKAELTVKGEKLLEADIPAFDNESFYAVIVNVNGVIRLYVAPNESEKDCRLLFEAVTEMKEGGCITFFNRHTRALICNARLKSIDGFHDADDYLSDVVIAPSKHRYMI